MAFKDGSVQRVLRLPNNDMTSTVLRRLFANFLALTLFGAGLSCTWFTPLPSFELPAYALAVALCLFTSRAYLSPIVALAATASLTAAHWLSGTAANATSVPLAAGISLIWLLALFVWLQQRQRSIPAREFSKALDKTQTGLLITDTRGKIVSANAQMASLIGQGVEQLVGRHLAELIGESLWQRFSEDIATIAKGETLDIDFDIEQEEGRPRKLSLTSKLAHDAGGKPAYFVIQLRDTSREQAAQRSLKNANLQTRRILGKASDLVLFTDHKLHVTYANSNASNVLGSAASSVIGKPIYQLISPADRRAFMKGVEQLTQQPQRNEISIAALQLADGEETPASARIIRLAAPEKKGYAVLFGVVERHLKALAHAKASQARFSQVFHGTPDAILLLRAADTMVLDLNEGFTRLLGYTREDAIGDTELHGKLWTDPTERDAIIERIRQEREILAYETTLRNRQGTIVHVEISLRYVQIDNELCMLCIGRDITKRVSAEAALVESEEKFEKVFSQSPDGIVILRLSDGVITDLNKALLSRSGYTREEVVGQSLYEVQAFIDADDLAQVTEILNADGRINNRAVTFQTRTGEAIPSLISATVVELSGEAYVMVIAKDISKQRTTEERLRSSEERFRGIFENAPIGIMLVDMQGRIFQANRTAADLLAYDEQHMYGLHISRLVPSEDRPSLKESLSSLALTDKNTERSERRMICQNGLEIWTNFHVVLQQNGAGEALYYIVQIADISDIKRSQQRMERMAFYDTLTNLANRRLFHDRLEHAIEHCVRADKSSALLYLDLDNFKRVNDTLGHQVGDHLLREVATRLQQCVRSEDTVGRTGGDEFTILLNEIGSPTDAGVVAQKILNHLREPIHVSGHPLIVTTSIGITIIPGDAVDPNVLTRNADLAMYKAKERGRNNYQFYSEDLNTNAVKRLRTEYEIRQALERQEFELYYQPKVTLRERKIVGVESLIRWNHPERGLLTPDEFIEVAEDTGTIIDIGTWVIEEACRACQILSEQRGEPVQVAVNISPRQFRDPNLVATMRRSLRETQLDPQNIEVEITETMLMQDVEAAQITVQRLSDLGVKLAIDDFGTGYSSLNYLKRFPINTVKVDKSFVTGLPSSADDMAITRAVIAMAHQLKMEVVAEGVETKQQLEFLALQKCEYAQGWLFSKALPFDQVADLLASDLGVIHLR